MLDTLDTYLKEPSESNEILAVAAETVHAAYHKIAPFETMQISSNPYLARRSHVNIIKSLRPIQF